MEERFLYDLRRAPSPEFSRKLRASLERRNRVFSGFDPGGRATRFATAAASVALVSLAFTLPAVRAGAQAFLDLFRVVNFAAVPLTAERLGEIAEIGESGLDFPRLLGEEAEILIEPAPPVSFATADEAGALAGIDVLEPAWLPVGWSPNEITVQGESSVRFTAETETLRLLLDQLGIVDLTIPDGLDGQSFTVSVPPAVHTVYRNGDRRMELVQARSPEVSIPDGLELSELAEIALRIIGLDREEAFRLAWTIDWSTTLIVPVPANTASFREVDVAGNKALLLESLDRAESSESSFRGRLLFWSSGDRVYALFAPLSSLEMLEIAQTTQ